MWRWFLFDRNIKNWQYGVSTSRRHIMSTTAWFWIFTTIYAASALISFFVLLPMVMEIGWDDPQNSKTMLFGMITWFVGTGLFVFAYHKLNKEEWLVFLSMATGIASAIALALAWNVILRLIDSIRTRGKRKQFHGARTTTW